MNEHLSKISEMLKKCIGVRGGGGSVTGSTSNCSIYLFVWWLRSAELAHYTRILLLPVWQKRKKGWSYLFLLSLNFSVYRMLWDEYTPVLDKMHLAVGLFELDIPYVLWNQILTWILHCRLSTWLFQRIFHKQVLTLSICYIITLVQANAEIVFSSVYFHNCDLGCQRFLQIYQLI